MEKEVVKAKVTMMHGCTTHHGSRHKGPHSHSNNSNTSKISIHHQLMLHSHHFTHHLKRCMADNGTTHHGVLGKETVVATHQLSRSLLTVARVIDLEEKVRAKVPLVIMRAQKDLVGAGATEPQEGIRKRRTKQ